MWLIQVCQSALGKKITGSTTWSRVISSTTKQTAAPSLQLHCPVPQAKHVLWNDTYDMSDVESDGPGSSSAVASGSKLTAAKRGKTKSALWAHFDELGQDKASCKTCGTSIAGAMDPPVACGIISSSSTQSSTACSCRRNGQEVRYLTRGGINFLWVTFSRPRACAVHPIPSRWSLTRHCWTLSLRTCAPSTLSRVRALGNWSMWQTPSSQSSFSSPSPASYAKST